MTQAGGQAQVAAIELDLRERRVDALAARLAQGGRAAVATRYNNEACASAVAEIFVSALQRPSERVVVA